MSKDKSAGPQGPSEGDWRAESDLRTLIEAEKIKADKPRLKAALAKKDEQAKALNSLEAKK